MSQAELRCITGEEESDDCDGCDEGEEREEAGLVTEICSFWVSVVRI